MDHKIAVKLENIVLVIYFTWHDEEKAKVRVKETENRLSLKGTSGDLQMIKHVEPILKIALEASLEKIQRQIIMPNEIYNCTVVQL